MSCLLNAEELQRRVAEGNAPPAALVPLFEMRRFDLTNLTASGASRDITVVLQPALCVVDYSQVRLAVRVHALSMSVLAVQTLSILAYGTLPSEEDPAQDFVDQSTHFLRLDLTASTTVPSLVTSSGWYPDPYLKFVLFAEQASSSFNLTATLSASVLLRRM